MPRVRTGVLSVTVWHDPVSHRMVARIATVDDILLPQPEHHMADSVPRIVEIVALWLSDFVLLPPIAEEGGTGE
jgi:hypothetical protein